MRIKQVDIANKLGISRVTVTKALKNSSDISEKTKTKVKKMAQKMEYIPNLTARHLTTRKTKTIGIVLPDITNFYFISALRGMMEIAENESYHIILTDSKENKDTESENILKLLSINVDGILICQTLDTVESRIFERVKEENKPLVFFGRPIEFPGYDFIGFDDYSAAQTLTEYLIKEGKTKIAHISGNLKSDGYYRMNGYLDTMKKHNLEIRDEWLIGGKCSPEYGYNSFKQIYESGNLPEVIFCANGMIVRGLYEAIRDRGLKIPDDIFVVAIDHKVHAEILYPKLTYIYCPTELLGQEAMKMIIFKTDSSEKESQIDYVILDTYLIDNSFRRLI